MTHSRDSEMFDIMCAGLKLYLRAFQARTGLPAEKARNHAQSALGHDEADGLHQDEGESAGPS
jgi:hypothetical protein